MNGLRVQIRFSLVLEKGGFFKFFEIFWNFFNPRILVEIKSFVPDLIEGIFQLRLWPLAWWQEADGAG
jgi:hypothetical protein